MKPPDRGFVGRGSVVDLRGPPPRRPLPRCLSLQQKATPMQGTSATGPRIRGRLAVPPGCGRSAWRPETAPPSVSPWRGRSVRTILAHSGRRHMRGSQGLKAAIRGRNRGSPGLRLPERRRLREPGLPCERAGCGREVGRPRPRGFARARAAEVAQTTLVRRSGDSPSRCSP